MRNSIVLAVVILSACAEDEPHYDYPCIVAERETCSAAADIARARCDKAEACGELDTSYDQCVADEMNVVCDGIDCNVPTYDRRELDGCLRIAAINVTNCGFEVSCSLY